jgi:bifunctional UDP-N-acetylglucosamine pyrophosphorylase/glucosamine-1-phosphate N-acetyltransferase
MKAVILAAGEGTRLRPFTLTRPKHLISVGGKTVIEYSLDAVKNAGVNEVIVVAHYKTEQLKDFLGDGSKFGLTIEYAHQNEMKGTADAIKTVESNVNEDFLLIYGDILTTSEAIKSVIKGYIDNKPAATMAVVQVTRPEHYGIVKLENHYITDILEKPKPSEAPTNLANAGVYVFSKGIFQKIHQTPLSPRGELEITDTFKLLIEEKRQILAVQIPTEDWLDIGRPWDLLEANKWALSRIAPKVHGKIEDNVHLIGAVIVCEGARVRSGAYIEGPTFIGENSDIGPNCYIRPYTHIGKQVHVGNACEIKNSIIMDNTKIGHLSYVGDSVIGEECNFGAGTLIANYRFDAKSVKMMIKEQVVDTGKVKLGVFLGDKVKTGINATLMPGVKVGNNCWIGPNVIVYRDLPANTRVLLKQDVEQKKLEETEKR